jgi:hypothetical protein
MALGDGELYILDVNSLPHGKQDNQSVPVVALHYTHRPGTNEEEVAVALSQDINGSEEEAEAFIVPATTLRRISAEELKAIQPLSPSAAEKIRHTIGKAVEAPKIVSTFRMGLRGTDPASRLLALTDGAKWLLKSKTARLPPDCVRDIRTLGEK